MQMTKNTGKPGFPSRSFGKLLLGVICVICLFSAKANAYGDPGSGALLWQLLLAAFFGGMFYIRRIVSWVRGKLGRKQGDGEIAGDG